MGTAGGVRLARTLAALLALVAITGCAPMVGTPSLTLLAADEVVDDQFVPLGKRVEESDCLHWALILFMWGTLQPSHEAVVQRMLDENDADVILEAQVTTSQYGIPYLYLMSCSNVEGIPARRADAGDVR